MLCFTWVIFSTELVKDNAEETGLCLTVQLRSSNHPPAPRSSTASLVKPNSLLCLFSSLLQFVQAISDDQAPGHSDQGSCLQGRLGPKLSIDVQGHVLGGLMIGTYRAHSVG